MSGVNVPMSRQEMQNRARRLLSSDSYLIALEKCLINRTIPPAVEVMLHHYAYGKPVETVNLNVAQHEEDLSKLTGEQLEERAANLVDALRQAREMEEVLDGTVVSSVNVPPGTTIQ